MVKYKALSFLPKQLRKSLPEGAQKVYLQEFNRVYSMVKDKTMEESKERYAHRLAWSRIMQDYQLMEEGWREKSTS